MTTAEAITQCFESQVLSNRNLEPANVVEALADLVGSNEKIAKAITANAADGIDATGGSISSLTEAVMGMTAGLCKIADAISDLAEAVRESK